MEKNNTNKHCYNILVDGIADNVFNDCSGFNNFFIDGDHWSLFSNIAHGSITDEIVKIPDNIVYVNMTPRGMPGLIPSIEWFVGCLSFSENKKTQKIFHDFIATYINAYHLAKITSCLFSEFIYELMKLFVFYLTLDKIEKQLNTFDDIDVLKTAKKNIIENIIKIILNNISNFIDFKKTCISCVISNDDRFNNIKQTVIYSLCVYYIKHNKYNETY